jgi:hypothetical protein
MNEPIKNIKDLVKQDPPTPIGVEIEYNQETRNMTRSKLLEDYGYIIDNLRQKERRMNTEFHNIEQILGAALGFPWFKDDQKNFPNATEADGVCVGDHTAWSLAMCAADKIKELEEELEKWKACADMLFEYADEVKCGTHIQALWEAACQDIEKYKELKNENRDNQTNS